MTTINDILSAMGDPRMRHAAVVHMPIAISALGLPLALALALTRGRSKTLRWSVPGIYLVLLASALAAVNSGGGAKAELVEAATAARMLIDRHEWMARKVWMLALFTAGSAACVSLHAPRASKTALGLCVVGALACAGWLGMVGHHGGSAVYAYGVGTPSPVTDRDLADAERVPDADAASTSSDPRREHFRVNVRPLLASVCMGCHAAGAYASSGLDLSSMRAALAGGDRGPALVPGNPAASLLYQAVTGTHDSLRMPQGRGPLDPEQIEHLRLWIEQGAVWSEE